MTINASIRFWKQKHFYFNEFSETKALVIGDPVIPVPTAVTMFRPFRKGGLFIRHQSTPYEVCPRRPQQYDNENDEQPGMPYIRTFRGGQYLAYPYPDQAYSATWYGLRDYADLVDDDTNDFTEKASNLILYETLARLMVEFRIDTERAEVFSSATNTEFTNLKSTTEAMTGTGVLEVETIL